MHCAIFSIFFFFQAEDGIRDLVRSRGLGDVYKRQVVVGAGDLLQELLHVGDAEIVGAVGAQADDAEIPVSYTHLTLPTSDLV